MCTRSWNVSCLQSLGTPASAPSLSHSNHYTRTNGVHATTLLRPRRALIVLNQPFSAKLLKRVWASSDWHCCADGGGNRLHDVVASPDFGEQDALTKYKPNLIKGDGDSLRPDVREFYASQGVEIINDADQNSTDLMKCVAALEELEAASPDQPAYELVLLGGLAGRLDQTIHTLSYLHKLRKTRERVMAVTDDNIGWVLDSGKHEIHVDHSLLGPTCGLLPVGVDQTLLTTSGLRWNLDNHPSGFDGLVSTSNHLVKSEEIVRIETSNPIWWTMELRDL